MSLVDFKNLISSSRRWSAGADSPPPRRRVVIGTSLRASHPPLPNRGGNLRGNPKEDLKESPRKDGFRGGFADGLKDDLGGDGPRPGCDGTATTEAEEEEEASSHAASDVGSDGEDADARAGGASSATAEEAAGDAAASDAPGARGSPSSEGPEPRGDGTSFPWPAPRPATRLQRAARTARRELRRPGGARSLLLNLLVLTLAVWLLCAATVMQAYRRLGRVREMAHGGMDRDAIRGDRWGGFRDGRGGGPGRGPAGVSGRGSGDAPPGVCPPSPSGASQSGMMDPALMERMREALAARIESIKEEGGRVPRRAGADEAGRRARGGTGRIGRLKGLGRFMDTLAAGPGLREALSEKLQASGGEEDPAVTGDPDDAATSSGVAPAAGGRAGGRTAGSEGGEVAAAAGGRGSDPSSPSDGASPPRVAAEAERPRDSAETLGGADVPRTSMGPAEGGEVAAAPGDRTTASVSGIFPRLFEAAAAERLRASAEEGDDGEALLISADSLLAPGESAEEEAAQSCAGEDRGEDAPVPPTPAGPEEGGVSAPAAEAGRGGSAPSPPERHSEESDPPGRAVGAADAVRSGDATPLPEVTASAGADDGGPSKRGGPGDIAAVDGGVADADSPRSKPRDPDAKDEGGADAGGEDRGTDEEQCADAGGAVGERGGIPGPEVETPSEPPSGRDGGVPPAGSLPTGGRAAWGIRSSPPPTFVPGPLGGTPCAPFAEAASALRAVASSRFAALAVRRATATWEAAAFASRHGGRAAAAKEAWRAVERASGGVGGEELR